MKKLIYILFFSFAVSSCTDSYHEYKVVPLPDEMNTVYLKDALRYLSLTVAERNVINASFTEQDISTPVLLTFPKEGMRVLIIKDNRYMTQTVNIVSAYNGIDIYKAKNLKMIDTDLFTFPVNPYFHKIYTRIRKDIIHNLNKHYSIRINALGSASVYATMLGIEMSALEIPLESIVNFGPARFATQTTHDQIKQSFGNRLISITHIDDISHKMHMGGKYAEHIIGEYTVCANTRCHDATYILEEFPLRKLTEHISNFPHTYAEMYHDSILYMEEDEHRREAMQ